MVQMSVYNTRKKSKSSISRTEKERRELRPQQNAIKQRRSSADSALILVAGRRP